MKAFITFLLISSSAFATNPTAPQVLAKITTSVYFSPAPYIRTIRILEDGHMIKAIHYTRQTNPDTESLIGVLSPEATKTLSDASFAVDSNDTLEDSNPDGPQCMDAPVTDISVIRGDKEVITSRFANCHTSEMYSPAAMRVNAAMQAASNLADLVK